MTTYEELLSALRVTTKAGRNNLDAIAAWTGIDRTELEYAATRLEGDRVGDLHIIGDISGPKHSLYIRGEHA